MLFLVLVVWKLMILFILRFTSHYIYLLDLNGNFFMLTVRWLFYRLKSLWRLFPLQIQSFLIFVDISFFRFYFLWWQDYFFLLFWCYDILRFLNFRLLAFNCNLSLLRIVTINRANAHWRISPTFLRFSFVIFGKLCQVE
jgi:hypothetical protein